MRYASKSRVIASVVVAVLAPLGCLAGEQAPQRDASQQIARWVEDLDSSSFSVREHATRQLLEAGAAAIEPLAALGESASVEQISRGVAILTALSLDSTDDTRTASGTALEKLARSSDDRLARRAHEALEAFAAAREQATIAKIEQLGGRVDCDEEEPSFDAADPSQMGRGWATAVHLNRSWHGRDADLEYLVTLRHVKEVELERSDIGDSALAYLAGMPQLERLSLLGPSRITGVGLGQLEGLSQLSFLSLKGLTLDPRALDEIARLKQLESLGLDETNLTDADLARLAPLANLRVLWLNHTKVTDAGLAHLKSLAGLSRLELAGTEVTGAGLAELKPLTRLTFLTLESTAVDDAGAAHLAELGQLKQLGVDRTKITDAALGHIAQLQNLEELWLSHTPITDAGLARLSQLANLRVLHLRQTKVTGGGIRTLRRSIPHLQIQLN